MDSSLDTTMRNAPVWGFGDGIYRALGARPPPYITDTVNSEAIEKMAAAGDEKTEYPALRYDNLHSPDVSDIDPSFGNEVHKMRFDLSRLFTLSTFDLRTHYLPFYDLPNPGVYGVITACHKRPCPVSINHLYSDDLNMIITPDVAMKSFRADAKHPSEFAGDVEYVLGELNAVTHIARMGGHPNIARLVDAAAIPLGDGSVVPKIITELYECDLEQYVLAHPVLEPKWKLARAREIASAVAYLHAKGFMHRDIKAANIFLSARDGCAKLGDFGHALDRSILTAPVGRGRGQTILSLYMYTAHHRAPEILLGDQFYGNAADVWAMGCVFWFLYMREEFVVIGKDDHAVAFSAIMYRLGAPEGWNEMTSLPFYQQVYLNWASWEHPNGIAPDGDQSPRPQRTVPTKAGHGDALMQAFIDALVFDPNKRLSAEDIHKNLINA